MTTEGTDDWFAFGGSSATIPRLLANGAHTKALNGFSGLSFDWVLPVSQTTYSSTGSIPITTTLGDDTGGSLTSSTTYVGIYTATAGIISYGCRFVARADAAARTMKIYGGVFSGVITVTAHLSDASAADATSTHNTGAGVNADRMWTVVYNAARDGQVLEVTMLLTTNSGSSPNIHISGITVARN